jgi:hypothetical protein
MWGASPWIARTPRSFASFSSLARSQKRRQRSLLEFARRLPLRVDLRHLAVLVDGEAVFGAHGAGEDPAKHHERSAFDRVALFDEVVVELDHQGVEIHFLAGFTGWAGGASRAGSFS